jgi:hypothetical protein
VLSVERAIITEHAPAGFKPTSQIVTRGGDFNVTAE